MNNTENLKYSLPVAIEQYEYLKRHTYPLVFKIILFLFFVILSFFLSQFHKYKELNKKIKIAESAFLQKDYRMAYSMYNQLIKLYPRYEKGIFRLIQISFALAVQEKDQTFVSIANDYLAKTKLSKNDMTELQNYVDNFPKY